MNTPPDQDQRDIILNELDKTLLVEAAAGTGKTTGMIGRMVNLLAAGKCSIDALVAVTFTRKAAAELRARFQVELEKASRSAAPDPQRLLSEAVSHVERCFIGTIHSFCARMLRERPVEAGVDVGFEEIDEAADQELRRRAWDEYVAGLYANHSPILTELEELGVEVGQLREAFMKFADYPDVEEWPARRLVAIDPGPALKSLAEYVRHMERLVSSLPEHPGSDTLIPRYQIIPLMFRQVKHNRPHEIMEVLAQFTKVKIVKKNWPERAPQAEDELKRWDDFRVDIAEPLVKAWLEYRYEPLLRAIQPARKVYDKLRKESGQLNYQDLLMHAAHLLRDRPSVRDYFRRRFRRILVDEFQDTDPIQAEVLMFLTADDPHELDWRTCRPSPGALFVVGDPKQSIYRFRRADIVTYNQVKEIIRRSEGQVVHLSANFRTVPPLVNWVNETFADKFREYPAECSPEYVPLLPIREAETKSGVPSVRALRIPKEYRGNEQLGEYEGALIAGTIRHALDNGLTIPRTAKEVAAGISKQVRPGDFLIVTPMTGKLGAYSRKLQELGIPHLVTGGSAMNQVPEILLLHTCLVAVTQPDNPVALVAALRSGLFGISDQALYDFKQCGGHFSFHSPVPKDLESSMIRIFEDAFDRLRKYALWLTKVPPVPAIERISADLGLAASACAGPGGDVQAGSLAKAIELLRYAQTEHWTVAELVEDLGKLVQEDETHDAIPAKPHETPVVRVMNLHKVKGLEAPIVFLADPTGNKTHPVELHIDRSGDKVRGYMRIVGTVLGSVRNSVLALPEKWESFANKEEEFQQAEALRLRYVAATRAGCRLIVSQRETFQNLNPWAFFEPHLADLPSLADPGPQRTEPGAQISISEEDVSQAMAKIERQWADAAQKTYSTASAKAEALEKGQILYSHGEHGTEWGSIIHLLLQTAMAAPESDLGSLARSALSEQGLDSTLAEDALATVASVTRSEIWKRALESPRRMVEAPFQRLVLDEGLNGSTLGTILRGVIDLAFLDDDGWVIVDYKTDRVAKERLPGLIELYRPQVISYAEAWKQITGETVSEVGLYFTYSQSYVKIGTGMH
ncbi:MAG: UvrD-helicase domain-containing protein [Desulfomonilaceae bacterium]